MAASDGSSNQDKRDKTWWNEWLQTAKEKTSSAYEGASSATLNAYELVKRDLHEFSNVMKTDTSKVVAEAASTVNESIKPGENDAELPSGTTGHFKELTGQLRDGLSNMIESFTHSVIVTGGATMEDEAIPVMVRKTDQDPVIDRAKAHLRAIQSDLDTYCKEPEGNPDDFEVWLTKFDLDKRKTEISDLLVNNQDVRLLYTQLVPAAVSHVEFWQRYFYRIHQFEQNEQRKAALVQRADEASPDVIAWDDEDAESEIVEVQPHSTSDSALTDSNISGNIKKEQSAAVEASSDHSTRLPDSSIKSVETKGDSADALSSGHTLDVLDTSNEPSATPDVSQPAKIGSPVISEGSDVEIIDKTAEMSCELPANVEEVSRKVEDHCEAVDKNFQQEVELKTKEKGDMVVVGNYISSSSESNGGKEADLDDEWDEDVEVTEADLAQAREAAAKMTTDQQLDLEVDDDWENWS